MNTPCATCISSSYPGISPDWLPHFAADQYEPAMKRAQALHADERDTSQGEVMPDNRTRSTLPARTRRRMIALVVAVGCFGMSPLSSGSDHNPNSSGTDTPQREPSGGGSGVGVGIGVDLNKVFCFFTGCNKDKGKSSEPGDATPLARSGPKLQASYSMSGLVMQGLVKGGAPFVLDYDTRGARLRIEMKVQDAAPFVYHLEANGRALKIFQLPESFGDDPRAAIISVQAVKDQPGAETPAALRIYGMGMGKKAVGSVAIDQIRFGPPHMRVSRLDEARYSFHSRSDFNKAVVEFARLENRNGVIQVVERVNQEDLGELARNTWVGREQPRKWDGKNRDGEASPGLHLLTVRAWRSSVKEGDWVVSWSPDWVEVEE